ncbi:MAG TPA: ABC transporter permease [Mobilitalea sp.]|nr:ABC transporter permease [Mobilitalea sp.]
MRILMKMILMDLKRRTKDGFVLGYNIIFPILMIILLGYLTSGNYGKHFTGYQYYSVVMLPFCIAMAMITAAYAGKDEAYKKTAVRFLFSPVSRIQIVLSKLISCALTICICNLVVLIIAKLAFGLPADLGLIPIFLLLASETFAVCAAGLLIGLGMKNFILIKNLLNIPICLAAILAGSFYPIGTLNSRLELVLKLSPLTWMNRSIFLFLYDNNLSLLWKTALIFFVTGLGLTLLAVTFFKKEEFIYGDLPGYEK